MHGTKKLNNIEVEANASVSDFIMDTLHPCGDINDNINNPWCYTTYTENKKSESYGKY